MGDAVRATQRQEWGRATQLWEQVLMEAQDLEERKLAMEQRDYVVPRQVDNEQLSRRDALKWLSWSGVGVAAFWILRQALNSDLLDDDDLLQEHIITISPIAPDSQQSIVEVVKVNNQGEIIKRSPITVGAFIEDLGNGAKFTMVQIPGRDFTMGSPPDEAKRDDDEGPQHLVTVPSFFMGMVTVTQALYETVMGENPATKSDRDRFIAPNKPIINVSWNDAIAFCRKLSERTRNEYRLPSEAEWEYACRAGTTSPFHFGPTLTTAIANYNGNYTYSDGPEGVDRDQTTPVGSFHPNAFGLYDMYGNVWEWCADHWHESYEGAPTDGSTWVIGGNSDFRLLRDGAYTRLEIAVQQTATINLQISDISSSAFA